MEQSILERPKTNNILSIVSIIMTTVIGVFGLYVQYQPSKETKAIVVEKQQSNPFSNINKNNEQTSKDDKTKGIGEVAPTTNKQTIKNINTGDNNGVKGIPNAPSINTPDTTKTPNTTSPPDTTNITKNVNIEYYISKLQTLEVIHKKIKYTYKIKCSVNGNNINGKMYEMSTGQPRIITDIQGTIQNKGQDFATINFNEKNILQPHDDLPKYILKSFNFHLSTNNIKSEGSWASTDTDYHGYDGKAFITSVK